MDISSDILNRIRDCIGPGEKSLHEPHFHKVDHQLVAECIETGYVSSIGRHVNELEALVANYTNSKHAIAVNSGTSGLHVLLYSYGLKQEIEILLPAISFIATANSVRYCNGVPCFIDVDADTLNVCPQKLEEFLKKNCSIKNGFTINKHSGRRILGLIAVSVFGRPPPLQLIKNLCDEYNIFLFEDAAAALGSTVSNKHIAHYSEAAVISFNGNKIITAGGGGMILTNNDQLAKEIRHLITTAKVSHPWNFKHDLVGFNYRMPNLNAALACAQFSKLDSIISAKIDLLNRYATVFRNFEYGSIVLDSPNIKSNNWLINLKLNKQVKPHAQHILACLNKDGIRARPVWMPLHLQPQFKIYRNYGLRTVDEVWEQFISLPSSEYHLNV